MIELGRFCYKDVTRVLSMSCFSANVGFLGILDASVFCNLRVINTPVQFKSTPHNQHFHLFPVPI